MRVTPLLLLLGSVSSLLPAVVAVRPNDFKTCEQSGFCKRLRRLSTLRDEDPTNWESPYSIPSSSPPRFSATGGTLVASVRPAYHPDTKFELQVRFHDDGTARVRMDEVAGLRKRYDEAENWVVEKQPTLETREGAYEWSEGNGETTIKFGPSKTHSLHLTHSPLKLIFARDGVPQIVLNERGLLHMEHFRNKPDVQTAAESAQEGQAGAEAAEEKEKLVIQEQKGATGLDPGAGQRWKGFTEEVDGMWEESFNGKRDSKPKGPEALSLDISFPGKEFAYGIPEHASPLNLRNTRGGDDAFTEPYRLMNTDVFEYENDSPMSLYGSVPLMYAHASNSTVAIFWLSGSETWIDIERVPSSSSLLGIGSNKRDTQTHWFSESGILDLFIFLGPDAPTIMDQYTSLTGRTALPQMFAIGYHQCRWNYLSTDDVLGVDAKFDEADIPVDVIWLDIEYAEEHKYMVWDEDAFPNPDKMLEVLDGKNRKLVVIVDPHLKKTEDFYLYKEAKDNGLFATTADGSEYEGWCWTGAAAWLDFFNPKSFDWWKGQFDFKKWKYSAGNLFIWNDMNEPAIFNGPEITSPKDNVHFGGWEHRDIHNINGMIFHNATGQALIARESPAKRPFVLSRSWFAGSQRYGAIWTGDNQGTWEHLAVSVPMNLANGIGGMTFSGADIGGFFGNPSPEMLVRWYQAGIFEPFFRAHAHIDTKRREPYLLEEPYRSYVRDLIRLRYALLPAWYTAFKEANTNGMPVLRPHYLMFPDDVKGFSIDDQFYVGSSGLLVKPVVKQGAEEADVYLAEDQPYYDYFTHEIYPGSATGRHTKVGAPLSSKMPLFHRGGSILPLRPRVRRSAELMWRDPVSLVVALNKPASSKDGQQSRAEGFLYLDDGSTYDYEKGAFIWRKFTFVSDRDGTQVLASRDVLTERRGSDEVEVRGPTGNAFARALAEAGVRVDKVVVLGLDKAPSQVKLKSNAGHGDDGRQLEFKFTPGASASASAGGSVLGSLGGVSSSAGKASELVIKDPQASVVEDWEIVFM